MGTCLSRERHKELCKEQLQYTTIKNGEQLAYRTFGEEIMLPDKKCKTVILIHGLLSSQYWWDLVVQYLIERMTGYRIITIDLRGFGSSSNQKKANSIFDFSQDVAEFCQALEIPTAHIVGWSFGGAVSTGLAIKHPQIVKSLSLINATPVHGSPRWITDEQDPTFKRRGASIEEIMENYKDIQNLLDKIKNQDVQNQITETRNFAYANGSHPPENIEVFLTKQQLMQQNLLDVIWALNTFDVSSSKDDLAKTIKCPIFLFHGKQDQVIVISRAEANAKELGPKCETHYNDEVGHCPLIEIPSQLAKLINDFIVINNESQN